MIGQITNINRERGFGFLNSENLGSLYFKIRDTNYNNFAIGDKVAFEVNETEKGYSATAIRKVYINSEGVAFISRINQHHIHLNLDEYLPQIIDRVSYDSEDIIELEHEFPQYIGETHCVPTSSNDKIIYCIRKGRLGHSRFVLDCTPRKSRHVFAVFKKIEMGFVILTIFVGRKAAREPWDEYATIGDLLFWQNNALIFNEENIINGSKTTECPWILNQPAICKVL